MKKQFILFTVLGLLLTACGPSAPIQPTPDVNAIHTAAAQTVVAEFTMTALAVPTTTPEQTATEAPTATPEDALPTASAIVGTDLTGATVTPIPCDDADFDTNTVDVNFPDRTELTPGQDFVKTWKIKNTGTCTFTSAVAPGEEVEVSVRFKAPDKTGEYSSTWRMANASNSPFGKNFYVLIVVR